jgi:hypothetical protein
LDIADGELVTIISLGYPAEYPGPAEPRKSPITWIGP